MDENNASSFSCNLRTLARVSQILVLMRGRSTCQNATQGRPRVPASKLNRAAVLRKMRLYGRLKIIMSRYPSLEPLRATVHAKKALSSGIRKCPCRRREGLSKSRKIGPVDPAPKETEVEIKLTTFSPEILSKVRYNFKTGLYEKVSTREYFEEIFSQDSKICLKEDMKHLKKDTFLDILNEKYEGDDDTFDGVITKAELRRLDAQPNPFNFSERVTQTAKITTKESAIQTEEAPSTTFSMNVGLSVIYDAYKNDYERQTLQEQENDKKKERLKDKRGFSEKEGPSVDLALLTSSGKSATSATPIRGRGEVRPDISTLATTVRIMERMISQNTYDEVAQDFRFWDDGSDDYRPLEGSLLPLWKLKFEKSKSLVVSCAKWSSVYPDLLGAAYTTGQGEVGGPHSEGMLCLYSLKNPSSPERVFRTPCGVTCLEFHPTLASVIAAGWADGSSSSTTRNPLQILR